MHKIKILDREETAANDVHIRKLDHYGDIIMQFNPTHVHFKKTVLLKWSQMNRLTISVINKELR